MKNWLKLALPVGLGIVAGIMHYQILVPKLTPHAYVQVNRDLKPGDRLDDSCLMRIDMPGEFSRLAKTLVPWDHRRVLSGKHATQELRKGDVVLYSDTSDYVLVTGPNEVSHAVQLSEGMVTPGSFRVGAALRFVMSRPNQGKADPSDSGKGVQRYDPATRTFVTVFPNKSRTLGPLRILAIGADTLYDARVLSTKDTYNPCNVTLAFPRDPKTGELVPWAERLLDALLKKSDESVVAVEVCEPAEEASLEPAVRPTPAQTPSAVDGVAEAVRPSGSR